MVNKHRVLFFLAFLIIPILLFLAFPTKASATTYYVAGDTGNDNNDGSQSSPWKTIQKAEDTMVSGDTVNVKGGVTYTGSYTSCPGNNVSVVVCIETSGSSGNYITYQAWAGTGIPVIDAKGETQGFNVQANYIVISGFEVKNAGVGGGGASNNHGISIDSNNVIIKNNIVHNNTHVGITAWTGSNYKIYNNSVYDTLRGILVVLATTAEVKNNIVVNNANKGIEVTLSSGVTIDYNNVWNNTIDYAEDATAGPNDISQDPMFVNAERDDFHLKSTSPSLDTGTTLSDVTTDLVGVSRPQGSAYDMGAFEYYAAVTLDGLPDNPGHDTTPTFTGTISTVAGASVSSVSYSLDYGSWSTTGVTANDDSFDSSSEGFTLTIPDSSALGDGVHHIRVRTTDSNGNTTDSSMYGTDSFVIDTVTASISDLMIDGLSSVSSGGVYKLDASNKMPSFSGKASDIYQGSEKTNSDGVKTTFAKVSSGPDSIILALKKLKPGEKPNSTNPAYTDYLSQAYSLTNLQDDLGNEKYTRFYITTPFSLTDGYYQVNLSLKDKAGNTYNYPSFYLSLNYQGLTSFQPKEEREELIGREEPKETIEKPGKAFETVVEESYSASKAVTGINSLLKQLKLLFRQLLKWFSGFL